MNYSYLLLSTHYILNIFEYYEKSARITGLILSFIKNMNFTEYQNESRKTALYPNVGNNFVYPTLGLSGEAGEVADKLKKTIRDDDGVLTEEKKREVGKELGDVLWYVSQVASELELSLDEIAQANLEKLLSRMDRGVIKGSGDNR